MPWPALQDFSQVIQNPQLCFKGTELEEGTVALNRLGMPLVFSGNFACVYKVSVEGRDFAVRCFTREITDQQSRYEQLSSHLSSYFKISARSRPLVYCEYLTHGISSKGNWYPIVKMDWVAGESLNQFVNSRSNDADILVRLADQWRWETTPALRGLQIAHNDLQHGNVMVQRDESVRLVDYDGMFLHQFLGERSPELGHKNYQHPQRTAEHYNANVDNFPTLVIYLSLLAVASDPSLWSFYNDDNLIFTKDDYANPGSSPLFNRLKGSRDSTVVKLAACLEEYCALPVEKVPDLETTLRAIPSVTAPPPVTPPATPQPPTAAPATGSGHPRIPQPQRPAPTQPAPEGGGGASRGRGWCRFIAGVILTALIAGGAYYWTTLQEAGAPPPPTDAAAPTVTPTQTPTPTPVLPAAAAPTPTPTQIPCADPTPTSAPVATATATPPAATPTPEWPPAPLSDAWREWALGWSSQQVDAALARSNLVLEEGLNDLEGLPLSVACPRVAAFEVQLEVAEYLVDVHRLQRESVPGQRAAITWRLWLRVQRELLGQAISSHAPVAECRSLLATPTPAPTPTPVTHANAVRLAERASPAMPTGNTNA